MANKQYSLIIGNGLITIFLFLALTSNSLAQDGGRVFTGSDKTRHSDTGKDDSNTKSSKITIKIKPTGDKPVSPEIKPKPIVKPILSEMIKIPAGSFIMGTNIHRPNERPIHTVNLTSFEIAAYELSNQEFELFVKDTNYITQAERDSSPITWRSYFLPGRENYPVVLVSWQDAVAYCDWLSEVTGEKYRLPTEAEWEYAARGGLVDQDYPFGAEINEELANFDTQTERNLLSGVVLDYLQPVNSYGKNGYGLYNVAGNVAEWCLDWYDEHYYENYIATDPLGPEKGSFKVIRGGGWASDSNACRVSYRNFNSTSFSMPYLGFRLVKASS